MTQILPMSHKTICVSYQRMYGFQAYTFQKIRSVSQELDMKVNSIRQTLHKKIVP